VTDLPHPLTPSDCDLRGYDWMRLLCQRLFTSGWYIAALKDSRGGIASLKLWWVAMTQCPAGSLPNDEDELCLLADFGQDRKTWRKHRAVAMRGFVLCSDNRYYHPVVAEEVLWAWERKRHMQHNRDSSAARMRRMRGRTDSTHPPHKPNGEFIPKPDTVTRNKAVTDGVTDASRDGGVARLVTSRALDRSTSTEDEKGEKAKEVLNTYLALSPEAAPARDAADDTPSHGEILQRRADFSIRGAEGAHVRRVAAALATSAVRPAGHYPERSRDAQIVEIATGHQPGHRHQPQDPQRTVVEQYAHLLSISLAEAATRLGVAA
jgi:hypothetical protein